MICYPIAIGLWLAIVAPYRTFKARRRTAGFAYLLPLKAYADYPFSVLVSDQFDRFSAPIEQRFTRLEVRKMLEHAGLTDIVTIPNHGWIGDGQRPICPSSVDL
jgi:hypothetical protein